MPPPLLVLKHPPDLLLLIHTGPTIIILDDSASSDLPRLLPVPLKPTGLAKSGPQTSYPEKRRDEKSLLFEVCGKVDGLFHDHPSFKCTL